MAAAIAASLTLHAQNPGEEAGPLVTLDPFQVEVASVTALEAGAEHPEFGPLTTLQDIPRALTYVGSETLVARGVDQVRDLAPLAPGVTAPFRFGNLTTPHIRGDVAESYRNGQRLGSAIFGVHPGFNSVESVTLVRGPGGVILGAGMHTGGYVNYMTKSANLDAQRTNLSLSLGAWAPDEHSWTALRWQVDHNQPLSETLAMRLSYEGQSDDTFYSRRHSAARNDYQDIFLATIWKPTATTEVEANFQYRHEEAPQLLGVNRPTPLLLREGLYYTGEPADVSLYAAPWFLEPTGTVELPRDALLLSPGDRSEADLLTGQVIVRHQVSADLLIINRSLVEYVDRERYHEFEYAEYVEGLNIDNRTEFHFPVRIAGLEGGAVTGIELRMEDRNSQVNYFNETFFNYDITNGLPASAYRFPANYYPGRIGLDGLPFFGAEEGSAESVDSRLTNAALFWQSELQLAPQWVLTTGLRGDYWHARSEDVFPVDDSPWRDTHDAVALSTDLALSWQPTEQLTYYVSWKRAAAIYGSLTGGGIMLYPDGSGGGFIDDDDFDNVSTLWELGGRWTRADGRVAASVTAFHQDRQRTTLRGGADNIEVQGIETELQARNGPWHAGLNVTYMDAYYRDSAPYQHGGRSLWRLYGPSVGGTGEGFAPVMDVTAQVPFGDYRIPGLSRWLVSGSLGYSPSVGFGASMWAEWQDRQTGNLDAEYWVPAQYTLNASVSWTADRWSLIVRALNLTDHDNWIHHGDPFMNNMIIGRGLPRRLEALIRIEL